MSANNEALLAEESTAELQPIVAFIVIVVISVLFLLPSRRKHIKGSLKPTGTPTASQTVGDALSRVSRDPLPDIPTPVKAARTDSATPLEGSRLKAIVQKRVIERGTRFGTIVQAAVLDSDEKHAERVAERRAELDSLRHQQTQMSEQIK